MFENVLILSTTSFDSTRFRLSYLYYIQWYVSLNVECIEHIRAPRGALGEHVRCSVFTRFVEAGRVAYINYGPNFGKLCTIVDIIDGKRVLIDGPTTGVKRQQISVSRLYLTDFVISIERGAKSAEVKNAFVAGNIDNKWKETSWAKKLAARAEKAAMNDFARFKAHYAKKH